MLRPLASSEPRRSGAAGPRALSPGTSPRRQPGGRTARSQAHSKPQLGRRSDGTRLPGAALPARFQRRPPLPPPCRPEPSVPASASHLPHPPRTPLLVPWGSPQFPSSRSPGEARKPEVWTPPQPMSPSVPGGPAMAMGVSVFSLSFFLGSCSDCPKRLGRRELKTRLKRTTRRRGREVSRGAAATSAEHGASGARATRHCGFCKAGGGPAAPHESEHAPTRFPSRFHGARSRGAPEGRAKQENVLRAPLSLTSDS